MTSLYKSLRSQACDVTLFEVHTLVELSAVAKPDRLKHIY